MEMIPQFATPILFDKKPNFLNSAKLLAEKYLDKIKKEETLSPIYPLYQTDNFLEEESLKDLYSYILETSHRMLYDLGYDMTNFKLFFTEFWVQEHLKTSSHEYHTHPGNLISAFYFLDVPENSSKIIFYDPRPAKEFSETLPQRNEFDLTFASKMVNYTVEPGQVIFAPAWLPHSFSRNESDKPFKFIHANISHYFYQDNTKAAIII